MIDVTHAAIGNKIVHAKEVPTHGNYFQTLNNLASDAPGALSIMMAIEKAAFLMENHEVAARFGTYTLGTTVPYLYGATYSLCKDLNKAKTEAMTPYLANRITHGIFDVSAMVTFTLGFFTKHAPYLQTAIVLNTASDATEAAQYAMDASEARKLLAKAKTAGASSEVQTALSAKANYSLLKVGKDVAGAVAGFFASYSILMKATLVSSTVAAVVGLTSPIFDILAYFQKNHQSKYFAEISTLA